MAGFSYARQECFLLELGSFLKVAGSLFAALFDEVIRYFLTFVERFPTSSLYSADVNEHVFTTIIWLDKAEAFGSVKPFYGSSCHVVSPEIRA